MFRYVHGQGTWPISKETSEKARENHIERGPRFVACYWRTCFRIENMLLIGRVISSTEHVES